MTVITTEAIVDRLPFEDVLPGKNAGASPRGSTYWRRVQSCPREHLLGNLMRWEPIPRAPALDMGLLWHHCLEAYYRTMWANQLGQYTPVTPERAAFEAFQPFRDAQGWGEFYELCGRMLDSYFTRWQNADRYWQIVGVESMIELPPNVQGFGFPYTSRLDMFIVDHSAVLPIGRHVEHKCLVGSTRIFDAELGDQTIDDLQQVHRAPFVATLRGLKKASVFRDEGVQDVVQVRTRKGRMLRLTANHKVCTGRGCVPAGALTADDFVIVCGSYPSVHVSDGPCTELFALVGYMLGDGTMSSGTFSKNDGRVLDDFAAKAKIFDPEGRFRRFDKSATHSGQIRLYKAHKLRAVLHDHGLSRCRAASKFVPSAFMRGARVQFAALIGALWSTDGCLDMQTDHSKDFLKPRFIYSTRSERLAQDVQFLLTRLGYDSSLKTSSVVYRGARRAYWTVQVVGESRLDFICDVISGEIPVSRTYPAGFLESIRDVLLARGLIGADSWFEDRVDTVVYAGRERVWDLAVPGEENFVANDIVVHNSAWRLESNLLTGYGQDDQVIGQIFLNQFVNWAALGVSYGGGIVNITTKAKKDPINERIPVFPSAEQIQAWTRHKRWWHRFAQEIEHPPLFVDVFREAGAAYVRPLEADEIFFGSFFNNEDIAAQLFPKNYTQCVRRYGRCAYFDYCRNFPSENLVQIRRRHSGNDLPERYRKQGFVPQGTE